MKKAYTLIEILIVIIISSLILGAITVLYVVHQRLQSPLKSTSDIIEIQRSAMAQLEWFFNRWGTGTPCNDPTGANICIKIRPCTINNKFVYPPPSTLCVSIKNGDPCGELWFYGNFEGMAIVNNVYKDKAHLLSCRLKTKDEDGKKFCFHVMRYSYFLRDRDNNEVALIFSLKDLDNQEAECIDDKYNNPSAYNAECNRNATILNGNITNQRGNPQSWLNLEGGDIIIHLPKLIHIYCSDPDENGIRWLMIKKEFGDVNVIPDNCTKDRSIIGETIKIAPVVKFVPSLILNTEEITNTFQKDNPSQSDYLNTPTGAIKLDITFRNFEDINSPNYRTCRVIRIFGR